jgi:hypothetical protein
MNSHDKSDSYTTYIENPETGNRAAFEFFVGENDLALAGGLARAGGDHRKFMRQIFVSVDVTAPLYWWKEYDTYKVGTVANSESTMHTIHRKPFTEEDFSVERCVGDLIVLRSVDTVLNALNYCRDKFLETGNKAYWESMIQLLPSSFNQMRTCTLNYENLINIYHARRNHKLTEWHEYCAWIESLPYAAELICGGAE